MLKQIKQVEMIRQRFLLLVVLAMAAIVLLEINNLDLKAKHSNCHE